MAPTFGLLFRLALVVVGIYWCVYIIRRLPNDLKELRSLYAQYRARKDPGVLGTMQTEERRRNYQRGCVREFWTTLAVQLLFFWPVTVVVLIYLVLFLWAAIQQIANFIRNI